MPSAREGAPSRPSRIALRGWEAFISFSEKYRCFLKNPERSKLAFIKRLLGKLSDFLCR
jgi:hypothetical protein